MKVTGQNDSFDSFIPGEIAPGTLWIRDYVSCFCSCNLKPYLHDVRLWVISVALLQSTEDENDTAILCCPEIPFDGRVSAVTVHVH
jgi:hypothetical protein